MYLLFICLTSALFKGALSSLTKKSVAYSGQAQERYSARSIRQDHAEVYYYPYTVHVDLGMGATCGGVIIGEKWILTAGHCMSEHLVVFVNGNKLYGGTRCEVINAVRHPYYRIRQWREFIRISFDYMLLELKYPLTQRMGIGIVEIGTFKDITDGYLGTLTGYGDTTRRCIFPFGECGYIGFEENALLHIVELPIILHNRCLLIKPMYSNKLGLNEFCAGYLSKAKAPCNGDSGAPLVVGGKLVGIVSRGDTLLTCYQSPEIFSSVPFVRKWIKNVTNI